MDPDKKVNGAAVFKPDPDNPGQMKQFSEEDEIRAREKRIHDGCDPAHPHFSVGDLNVTKASQIDRLMQNKAFILVLSDSQCEQCCYFEPVLSQIESPLQTGQHRYHNNPI